MSQPSLSPETLLQCPVCFERLEPPIQTCENGHGVCGDCRRRIIECPTCRGYFSDFTNTLLNQLAESVIFNQPERTTQNFNPSIHLEATDKCFVCDGEFSLSALNSHFNVHNALKKTVRWFESFTLDIPLGVETSCQVVYVRNIERHFLVRYLASWEEEAVIFCVQYVGTREEADKYRYNITITQELGGNSPGNFACDGICLPYSYAIEDVIDERRMIHLNLASIFLDYQYLTTGFNIKIYLKRDREESRIEGREEFRTERWEEYRPEDWEEFQIEDQEEPATFGRNVRKWLQKPCISVYNFCRR